MAARSDVLSARVGAGSGDPAGPPAGREAATGRSAYRMRHAWLQRPRLPLRPPIMLLKRQSPEYP